MRDFAPNASTLIGRPAAGRSSFAGAVKRAWSWVSAPLRAYVDRELVLRELSTLDERSLADMGLSRSDVGAVADGLYQRGGLADRKFDPGA
jgi:uncharacterized protein YjiS (DUF1127 family)